MDPTVVNGGLGASILSAAEGLGVKCVTEPQPIPNTVTWRRQVTECSYQDLTVSTGYSPLSYYCSLFILFSEAISCKIGYTNNEGDTTANIELTLLTALPNRSGFEFSVGHPRFN